MMIISRRIFTRDTLRTKYRLASLMVARAKALVLEWWSIHREELEANWLLVSSGKEPNLIELLE